MKFGVVTFPGSNCDEDIVYVIETILKQKVERLWHKDKDVQLLDKELHAICPGKASTSSTISVLAPDHAVPQTPLPC